jgi:hypothetical protein
MIPPEKHEPPEFSTGPAVTTPDLMGKPALDLERQMPLRKHVYEAYLARLKRVPDPPVNPMFGAMWAAIGFAGGSWVAGYVASRSTSTVKPGTIGVLWVLTAAAGVIAVVCLVCGFLLRKARSDPLAEIIEEMENMSGGFSWEDEVKPAAAAPSTATVVTEPNTPTEKSKSGSGE